MIVIGSLRRYYITTYLFYSINTLMHKRQIIINTYKKTNYNCNHCKRVSIMKYFCKWWMRKYNYNNMTFCILGRVRKNWTLVFIHFLDYWICRVMLSEHSAWFKIHHYLSAVKYKMLIISFTPVYRSTLNVYTYNFNN